MLKIIRVLRHLNVDVYFERENVSLHQQESSLPITAYCALSQAESESMSQNIGLGSSPGNDQPKVVPQGLPRGL